MILSVIELIEDGLITENKIFITPELVATFQKLWLKLVPQEGWQPRFFLPFFHLSSEDFWELELVEGAKVAMTSSYSPKSLPALKDSVKFAHLNPALFKLLMSPIERKKIRAMILNEYFKRDSYSPVTLAEEREKYLEQLELDFLSGQAATSQSKYLRMVETEARSVVFKTEVPKKYGFSCAISNHRLTALSGIQMVDACHIKPWSKTKDDSIQNGITLTPTLHRAFDRFLISIDEDYRVIVSKSLTENKESPFCISQFKGKQIHLPEKPEWYPSQIALEWHREQLL
ncbi:HNH endonuclease [Owenweeksia hongkongensis]|uniref:HNH endonuclease n=1 Tax=Owenweeksia hongkongensis TaxID=253245 RepID=UPI003A92765C